MTRSFGIAVLRQNSFVNFTVEHLGIIRIFWAIFEQQHSVYLCSIEFSKRTLQTLANKGGIVQLKIGSFLNNIFTVACNVTGQGGFTSTHVMGNPVGTQQCRQLAMALLAIEGKCSQSTNSSKTTRYSIKLWPNC